MANKKDKKYSGYIHNKTLKSISEFVLQKNGLTVLYLHTPGTGTVTNNLVYHVGSQDEAVGETGIAHMLEHMLFKPTHDGSGQKEKEIGHKILEDIGAQMNASTWLDRTNYFFTIPVTYFKKALSVEAHRMRYLLIEDNEFLPERLNVLSEYENYASIPSEILEKEIVQVAYVSHGYGHDTIGHKPDIQNLTVEKLRNFYDRYYWPNNATLIIVGDVLLEEVLSEVKNTFGKIPHSPHQIPRPEVVEPLQEGVRRIKMERKGPINIFTSLYKIPSLSEYDWVVLYVLSAYLSSGTQSVLEEKLVDTNKASSVDVCMYPTKDTGFLTISASVTTKSSHEEIEKLIQKEIDFIVRGKISNELLQSMKTKLIAEEEYSRDGTSALASQLTEYVATGDWARFYSILRDIKRVTKEDIVRVATQYLREDKKTIGTLHSTT